jgi:hypothetical protein
VKLTDLGHLKTEHTESLLLLRRHLGNWSRGTAIGMRSEMLVALEKLGQFSLLTVHVMLVYGEKYIFIDFETASFFCVFPVYELSGVRCFITI